MNLRFRSTRTLRGWTQEQLSSRTNLLPVDISRIEAQDWLPPQEIQQRLADALGVPIEAIFDRVREMTS